MKQDKLVVQETLISIRQHEKKDFISLTDIARFKDNYQSDYILQNWMRNKDTIKFLGLWEKINNENFNSIEFDVIKNKSADILNVALFGMTAKANKDKDSNLRDYANVNQLICLSNMESLNANFIQEGIVQTQRLKKLNQIAINQMKILNTNAKKLENK